MDVIDDCSEMDVLLCTEGVRYVGRDYQSDRLYLKKQTRQMMRLCAVVCEAGNCFIGSLEHLY